MGVILGEGEQQEIAAQVWVFSDSTSPRLGEVISPDLLATAVTLGTRGLVETDGEIVGITEVPQTEIEEFKKKQKSSLGDLRLIGNHVDQRKRRFISLQDAMPLFRESKFDDWSYSGPRAVREFLQSVQEGVCDLSSYHLQWIKHSGVNGRSSVVHEHRNLVEVLRLGISRDQVDVTNLLSFELVVRRLAQLEIAVSRCPSSPEFGGLDVLLESPVSEFGSASTRALDTWVTERLKERSNIQKQARLFREEMSMLAGRTAAPSTEPEGNPWRKRKPKAKAKSGGPSGATAEA